MPEPQKKNLASYSIIGSGVDLDGWWKYDLLNLKTGRPIKASKGRVAELRRAGRIVVRCICPTECDCQNPEPKSGTALVSNECPEHNLIPRVSPECCADGIHNNGAISK